MESGHPLQNYFLPRYYSILIPVTLGVILLFVIGEWVMLLLVAGCHESFILTGLFVSMVVMQQRAKQAAKQKPQ